MGLDTTHDCWHGPYSTFMRWRQWLNHLIAIDRSGADTARSREPSPDNPWMAIANMGATYEAINNAWAQGLYDDQTDPLNVLMAHSDCKGEIAANVCGPLADALQSLVDRRMPPRALCDDMRPATERFIAGLRKAATAGEPVGFH